VYPFSDTWVTSVNIPSQRAEGKLVLNIMQSICLSHHMSLKYVHQGTLERQHALISGQVMYTDVM